LPTGATASSSAILRSATVSAEAAVVRLGSHQSKKPEIGRWGKRQRRSHQRIDTGYASVDHQQIAALTWRRQQGRHLPDAPLWQVGRDKNRRLATNGRSWCVACPKQFTLL
jgi:hypothetical protein